MRRPKRRGYKVVADPFDLAAALRRWPAEGGGAGLYRPDRIEVVRRMTLDGASARQLAVFLGWSERQVVRWRGVLRAQGHLQ